jgi:hypothetical protein
VPSTLAEWADLLLGGWKLWKNVWSQQALGIQGDRRRMVNNQGH